jgi:isopentenyl diphosphate isomerase/L-lactate dehydrogenase-like FMN-dependent dehydrogenase
MWVGLPQVDGDRTFLDWEWIDRIRDTTTMRIFLKGIVTAEDAALSLEHGVDGVIVSNHGGRAEDSGIGTIESLGEVVDAIGGRIPVVVDSGFRRGTDIFKALAIGADAVAIGRPYLWGLGTFGQEGVETVLDILKRELEIVMKQAGTPTVAAINRSYIA